MKHAALALSLSLVVLSPGCRESAVDKSPAAEVSNAAPVTTSASNSAAQPSAGGTMQKVVKEKSSIKFIGAKVTRDHNGEFKNFDGSVEYVAGKPANVNFEIDVNSIETDDPKLTGHLKTPDFFDVAKYPKATFTSTSLTEAPAGSPGGATHMLKGTLNMHGVNKEITVPVVTQTTADGLRATSEFTINRHDWGISYKGMADDLIKDNVLIKLDLLFPPPPAA